MGRRMGCPRRGGGPVVNTLLLIAALLLGAVPPTFAAPPIGGMTYYTTPGVHALWLGHESIETTRVYLHADMKMKELALAETPNIDLPSGRYRPDDKLLAFLKSL